MRKRGSIYNLDRRHATTGRCLRVFNMDISWTLGKMCELFVDLWGIDARRFNLARMFTHAWRGVLRAMRAVDRKGGCVGCIVL